MRGTGIVKTMLSIAALLLAAGCGPSPNSSGDSEKAQPAKQMEPDASARLDQLIEQYAAGLRSDDDEGIQLNKVTAESYLQEIDSNRALLRQLSDIDSARLELEERIDQSFLIGLLESEIYSAEKRRIWENDASLYVPANQIGRLLEPEAVMRC